MVSSYGAPASYCMFDLFIPVLKQQVVVSFVPKMMAMALPLFSCQVVMEFAVSHVKLLIAKTEDVAPAKLP